MRKLLLSLLLGVSTISLFAQYPASTTPQNKKAILEEFTGIHCQYCPDGHLIAHNILVAHPGDAFMLAIHQGSYAVPSTGEPDYRTAFGDAIEGQTGLTGYPGGTINRHVFAGHGMATGSTAESRSYWSGDATAIIGQPSYLNVGIAANVDYVTRVLTIQCQVYYTANSGVATNKLNIALLQNNIKGIQTGSGLNPDMVTLDGLYLHQHMLRNFFTGQWGVNINNANSAAGTLKVDTTFTYTVPASFTSIAAVLSQLEVVAFVTEGNQEIVSGNGCLINPPAVDAGITSVSGLPTIQCSSANINPSIVLRNNGTDALTSAIINYAIDGGTVVTQNWSGNLAQGATETVAITNAIVPTFGKHTISCYTSMPNGVADLNQFNDSYASAFIVFPSYSTTPVAEEFTSTTFPPANWVKDGTYLTRVAASSYGVGAGSAKMDFYSASAGVINDLYIPALDLTAGVNHFMNFDHAYAQYDATYNDKLQVQVSNDCGTSWTTIFDKSGATLSTAAITTSAFTPTATQWVTNSLDLSAFDGQSHILIRFHFVSDYGNNMFVDKINTGVGFGINQINNNTISVYPNPTSDFVNIVNANQANITVYDVYGKLISSDVVNSNNYSLNVSAFAAGNYVLKITNGEQSISKKITVVK